jgi:putative ABC transport system permease protein
MLGIAVALFAFCMIRTLISSWYSGVEASAKNRLIVRNSVSLIFYLPLAYLKTIERVPGVTKVGYGNWFGGRYKDEEHRFAQFAIDENYFDIYSEFRLPPEERAAFSADKKGVLIGHSIAEEHQLKPGDVIPITGTIFPGVWEFTVRGVFRGRDDVTETRMLFFHWDYLNERNKVEIRRQPDNVGFYVVQIAGGVDPAAVSKRIDETFKNSFAETLTETETAFQQSFISMSATIITALDLISALVVGIMLLVLTNTMLMAARERFREYSILKAIGFGRRELAVLLVSESLLLAGAACLLTGAVLAVLFSLPPKQVLGMMASFFPVFALPPRVAIWALAMAAGVALTAALFPFVSVMRTKVSDGLRRT